jgi:hypothetical protein
MSDPNSPDARRSKLIGRIVIVAFGILLLAYLVPLALSFLK